MDKEDYLRTIRQAGFGEVAIVAERPYGAPEMDPRLQGRIISVNVRAVKPA